MRAAKTVDTFFHNSAALHTETEFSLLTPEEQYPREMHLQGIPKKWKNPIPNFHRPAKEEA